MQQECIDTTNRNRITAAGPKKEKGAYKSQTASSNPTYGKKRAKIMEGKSYPLVCQTKSALKSCLNVLTILP